MQRTSANKMQSEMADFTPRAATWRTGQDIRVVFDTGPLTLLHENMISSTVHNVLHCCRGRVKARATEI